MSSGKVKCTCGWSWNKSDSSKKDMYICHECGRDNSNNMKNGGWLDNYGEEDNYNDSQASAPEGMEGDGFSNVGRNYSPAWGGQFQLGGNVYPVNYVPEAQMGASIPGAVGFTYARTQGAAPSNGKYAKKTMASAQNGKEMQYYQNGLDFQPKTISRDGSVIKDDRGQWDHPGEVTEINSNQITMGPDPKTGKPLTRPLVGVSDTGDVKIMHPGKDYKFKGNKVTEYPIAQEGTQVMNSRQKRGIDLMLKEKDKAIKDERELKKTGMIKNPRSISYQKKVPVQDEVRSYTPQSKSSKAWEIATHPMTAFGYAARNEELPDNFSRGAINAHEQAVDIINPFFYADQAGQFVKNVATGHPLDAGLNALSFIPAAAEFAPELKAIGKGIGGMAKETGALASDLSKAKNIKEAVGRLGGFPIEGSLPRLSPEELKIFRQVQEVGRLRATNKPISQQYKYALEQDIPEEHLQKVFGKSKAEIESAIPVSQEDEALRASIPISERFNLQRQPRPSASTAQQADRDRLRQMMQGWDREVDATRIDPNEAQLNELASTMPDSLRERLNAVRARHETTQAAPIRTNSESLDDMFAQLDARTHSSQTQSGRLSASDWMDAYGSNSLNYGPGKIETSITNALSPLENIHNRASNKFINAVQDYPYYEGPVMENVPMLTLQSSGSLKNVSDKVANATGAGMKSGDIYTGSLNTSHSSYLPQLKQVFKSTEGAPQFFGYKPMNSMGFLSDYHYSQDDIAKYLNTEIDQQIKRGIIPKNVQRPYAKGEQVLLPHYGIKQFRGGGVIKNDTEYPIAQNGKTQGNKIYDFSGGRVGDMKQFIINEVNKDKKTKVDVNPSKKDKTSVNKNKKEDLNFLTKQQSQVKKSVQDQMDFTKGWMDSPMYKQMVDNSTTGIVDEYYLNQNRENNFNDVNIVTSGAGRRGVGADSNSSTGLIRLFPTGYNSPGLEGIVAHEASHSSDKPVNKFSKFQRLVDDPYSHGERNIPKRDIDLMQSYAKGSESYKNLFNSSALKDKELNEDRKWHNYITTPTETRARLNDIRYNAKKYNIYDPYTQKVNAKQIRKIRDLTKKAEGFDPFEQLHGVYNTKQIMNMLNSISQNDADQDQFIPMAKDGLRQEQKGLQNLDNLTNFTNYNKPQPGGWLNKYN